MDDETSQCRIPPPPNGPPKWRVLLQKSDKISKVSIHWKIFFSDFLTKVRAPINLKQYKNVWALKLCGYCAMECGLDSRPVGGNFSSNCLLRVSVVYCKLCSLFSCLLQNRFLRFVRPGATVSRSELVAQRKRLIRIGKPRHVAAVMICTRHKLASWTGLGMGTNIMNPKMKVMMS